MQRIVHSAMVAFWVGTPLLAVALAVSWPRWWDLGWPVEALYVVLVSSSAFLTLRAFTPPPDEDRPGGANETRLASETLAYPIILALAVSLFAGYFP